MGDISKNLKFLSPLNKYNSVHCVGIGGIGVSSLARWFLTHNFKISGSDLENSQVVKNLKRDGAKIFIGHKASNLKPSVDLVIRSAAIRPENPEIVKARESGIPIATYAEALGKLTESYRTVAVAGAHGKSTTTSLLSLILIKAGLDPTVIIGTKLKEFGEVGNGGSNFRSGKSDWLVIEADEYNSHFHHHSPFAAIILNIDREHLDYYKNLNEIKKSFLKFAASVRSGGILVLNNGDKNLRSLKGRIRKIAEGKKIKVIWTDVKSAKNESGKIRKVLKIPGEHNVSNALLAVTLAKCLGIKEKTALDSLSHFRGAWRRMEFRGEIKVGKLNIPVYDDYAHHPTEIKATLSGMKERFKNSKIICVFEPHQADRLKKLFKEFTIAFKDADYLVLLPIFKVPGRDGHIKVSSELLARRIKGVKSVYPIPSPIGLKDTLKGIVSNSPRSCYVLVMMGAGNIVKYTDSLLK